jgi:hypothetical protein
MSRNLVDFRGLVKQNRQSFLLFPEKSEKPNFATNFQIFVHPVYNLAHDDLPEKHEQDVALSFCCLLVCGLLCIHATVWHSASSNSN